jgi:hypothetical protein
MIVSPRSGVALRKNDTGIVLHEIRPKVEYQSQRELSQISIDYLYIPLHQRFRSYGILRNDKTTETVSGQNSGGTVFNFSSLG